MKKRMILGLLIICTGCAVFQSDPAGELNAAQISFERVIRSITLLIKDGKFSDEEKSHILGLAGSCEALLIQWEEVVFVEKRKPRYGDFRAYFDPMIDELISYIKEQ